MANENNLYPAFGSGQNISVTTTSASATLTGTVADKAHVLILSNAGASAVYVRWGVGAQTALVTDLCIPAGQLVVVRAGVDGTITVAAITLAGTSTLAVSFGSY